MSFEDLTWSVYQESLKYRKHIKIKKITHLSETSSELNLKETFNFIQLHDQRALAGAHTKLNVLRRNENDENFIFTVFSGEISDLFSTWKIPELSSVSGKCSEREKIAVGIIFLKSPLDRFNSRIHKASIILLWWKKSPQWCAENCNFFVCLMLENIVSMNSDNTHTAPLMIDIKRSKSENRKIIA